MATVTEDKASLSKQRKNVTNYDEQRVMADNESQ